MTLNNNFGSAVCHKPKGIYCHECKKIYAKYYTYSYRKYNKQTFAIVTVCKKCDYTK